MNTIGHLSTKYLALWFSLSMKTSSVSAFPFWYDRELNNNWIVHEVFLMDNWRLEIVMVHHGFHWVFISNYL